MASSPSIVRDRFVSGNTLTLICLNTEHAAPIAEMVDTARREGFLLVSTHMVNFERICYTFRLDLKADDGK